VIKGLSRMLNSVVHCSLVSFYVCFNLISVLLICIVSLTGNLTYMSLMFRVMSLNVYLIVSKAISCATCVKLSAMCVLGRCKIVMIFC
jgi:hypothetical protein